MARQQIPKVIDLGVFTTTAIQISAVEILTTSFIIQAPVTNTDFVMIGDALGQFFSIAPGKDFQVEGDKLDNGTSAYVDLSQWYIIALSGVQTGNVVYLERF